MKSALRRPWKRGTVMLVIGLVVGVPLVICAYLNFRGIIDIAWSLMAEIIGIGIFLWAWYGTMDGKPLKWLMVTGLLIVAGAIWFPSEMPGTKPRIYALLPLGLATGLLIRIVLDKRKAASKTELSA